MYGKQWVLCFSDYFISHHNALECFPKFSPSFKDSKFSCSIQNNLTALKLSEVIKLIPARFNYNRFFLWSHRWVKGLTLINLHLVIVPEKLKQMKRLNYSNIPFQDSFYTWEHKLYRAKKSSGSLFVSASNMVTLTETCVVIWNFYHLSEQTQFFLESRIIRLFEYRR